jgi:uncharacterized protein YdhG (YjbR/CyaY superfamily)
VRSSAETTQQYLDGLEPDRREVVEQLIDVVRESLPPGYEEAMTWGMPGWEVPLSTQPDTYNGKPLAYVSLAAQKHHYAVYLMGLYADAGLEEDFRARWSPPSGKALDMGKSCVRFRRLEDADLPLIGEMVAAVPVEEFVQYYASTR